jgi:RNA polymerase sigma factor (sigma-70 family)
MENQQQFDDILTQHKGIFLKVSKTYCKDEDERKDLLQEMMLQVWLSLPRYNPQLKLSTWLYRVVLNVAISHYRKATHRAKVEPLATAETLHIAQAPASESDHNLVLLEQFINQLNEFDKALVLLHLEEKSHAEISDILGISTSNVSTKILRIKEKLKQKFLKA